MFDLPELVWNNNAYPRDCLLSQNHFEQRNRRLCYESNLSDLIFEAKHQLSNGLVAPNGTLYWSIALSSFDHELLNRLKTELGYEQAEMNHLISAAVEWGIFAKHLGFKEGRKTFVLHLCGEFKPLPMSYSEFALELFDKSDIRNLGSTQKADYRSAEWAMSRLLGDDVYNLDFDKSKIKTDLQSPDAMGSYIGMLIRISNSCATHAGYVKYLSTNAELKYFLDIWKFKAENRTDCDSHEFRESISEAISNSSIGLVWHTAYSKKREFRTPIMDVLNHPNQTYLKHINNYKISESGCWDYQGKIESNGNNSTKRGRVSIKINGVARKYYVNRLSYAHHNNCDLYGVNVINKCGNMNCINPDHLATADQSETMKNAHASSKLPSSKGARNPNAKLAEIEVMQVLSMIRDDMNNKEIAQELGVSHSMISRIRLGHSWGHVTGIQSKPKQSRGIAA